jgi:2-polyprenyl-3-methyl-5-hydroxy-6-metoxy-1,4-benzoquinol methylase
VSGIIKTARPCPVCGGRSAELLYEQRFADFSAGSISNGYDVVACVECGMCFAAGLPAAGRFAQYYADSSKYDLGSDPAQLSARDWDRYADQAAFVAAHVADRATTALDVGTATGGFLLALRDAGFRSVRGVEPSPDAVQVATDHFGLDVRAGGLGEAAAWGQRFGLVTYIAVLEHLLTPRDQLREVTQVLSPSGYLFVSMPNAGAFSDGVDAPYQEFSVEHINFFTSGSLRNLMAAEGYDLVAERTPMLAFGSNCHGPALEAVYRWEGSPQPIRRDEVGSAAIREYIELSRQRQAGVIDHIARIAASGERIYVWGTGTHTLHLLETSRLGDCRIEAFLDSNPHYAGATLIGRPVIAPGDLAAADAPILVSSSVSQAAIADAARQRFGANAPLILLY